MLRTLMEMLHYPYPKFFVVLQKKWTQKSEKEKKKPENSNKEHLSTRFVK